MSSTAVAAAQTADQQGKPPVADDAYIPVAVATLVPATAAPCSLYLQDGEKYRLYCEANIPFDLDDRQQLLNRGISRVYVTAGSVDHYHEYLRQNLESVLEDESLPVKERFGGLNEVVRNVLQEDFSRGSTDRILQSVDKLADHAAQVISRSDVVASDVLHVMYHDYHTFTHSANVTYLTLLLASRVGTGQEELAQMATGALLHDLGKLQIPERILKKNGRLDEAEFAIIQQHPTIGFEALCQRTELNWAQLMMVYQHHEDWQGGGYPVGNVGEEIHPWARMCTIADVFEALTANRPYRRGMSIPEALNLMQTRMDKKFEPELFACFRTLIQQT